MSDDNPTLKPCPFCGSEVDKEHDMFQTLKLWWYVWCEGCRTLGPEAPTQRKAIEAWNRPMRETDDA